MTPSPHLAHVERIIEGLQAMEWEGEYDRRAGSGPEMEQTCPAPSCGAFKSDGRHMPYCELHGALLSARSLRDELVKDASEKWASIESAPKDGSWVILATPEGVQAGYWGPSYFSYNPKWIVYAHRSDCEEVRGEPTHWLPLPEPPKSVSDHERREDEKV